MKQAATLSETHIKIIFFALLIGVLGGIHLLIPDFYRTVWELSVSGNLDGTIEYLRSFGVWAVVVSMIIDIVINIVGFLPSIFISAANGVLFGIAAGTVVSWLAETIGVVITSFSCGRCFAIKLRSSLKRAVCSASWTNTAR